MIGADEIQWSQIVTELAGAMAVRKHTAAVEKLGAELLESLTQEDKVLVLITRNYGVSDPVLNMGIPKLLLERGYKVITRVEAFLNSLSHRETVTVSKEFDCQNVPQKKLLMRELPERNLPLFVPDFGWYSGYLAEYFKAQGIEVHKLPPVEEQVVQLGRIYTNSKEYLPFAALLGEVTEQRKEGSALAQYLIPQTLGAEADGQNCFHWRRPSGSLKHPERKLRWWERRCALPGLTMGCLIRWMQREIRCTVHRLRNICAFCG